jgi:hypothetical protein
MAKTLGELYGVLDEHAVKHIESMKQAGMKRGDIFTLSYQYCGQEKPKWCIYYGFKMVGWANSKRDAITIRGYVYRTPSLVAA